MGGGGGGGGSCNVMCQQGTNSVNANAHSIYQRSVYNDDSSPNVVCPDQTANVVQLDQGIC